MEFSLILFTVILVVGILWLVSRNVSISTLTQPGALKEKLFGFRKDEQLAFASIDGGDYMDDIQLGPVESSNGSSFEELNYDARASKQQEKIDDYDASTEAVEIYPQFEGNGQAQPENFDDDMFGEESLHWDQNHAESEEKEQQQSNRASPLKKIYKFTDRFDFAAETKFEKNHSPQMSPIHFDGESVNLPEPGGNEFQVGGNGASVDVNSASIFDKPKTELADANQAELEINIDFPDYFENIDRDFDIIGWLPGGDSVGSDEVLSVYNSLRVGLKSPLTIQGFDVVHGNWCDPRRQQEVVEFADVVFSIPFSHHGVSVSERDWWLFSNLVEDMASAFNRKFSISETTNTVFQRASEIGDRLSELDLQVVLLLKSDDEGHISEQVMNYLAREYQLEKQSGFPIYEQLDTSFEEPRALFSIVPINESSTILAQELGQDPNLKTLVFMSSLSGCSDPKQVFDSMIEVAQSIADRLSMSLVDLNDQNISFNSIRSIRRIINSVVSDMNEFGIEPGSSISVRSFGHSDYLREIMSEHTSPPELLH